MVDRIKMDMSELQLLGANLKVILDAFTNADADTEGWGAMTGEEILCEAVEDFGDKWRLKRAKMLENISTMQELVITVTTTFTEVDTGLSKSLEGDMPSPAPTGP